MVLGFRRVQEESNRRQQLLAQNNKLLQSLRVELRVYEKLDVELRVPRGTGAWAEAFLSQTGSAAAAATPHTHLGGVDRF